MCSSPKVYSKPSCEIKSESPLNKIPYIIFGEFLLLQLGYVYFCELMPIKDQKPPEMHHGATGAVETFAFRLLKALRELLLQGEQDKAVGQGCFLAELERCVPLSTKSATGCTCAAILNCV